MLLLKELHHDNIVNLKGAGFLPDGRRFIALVRYAAPGAISGLWEYGSAIGTMLVNCDASDLRISNCRTLMYHCSSAR